MLSDRVYIVTGGSAGFGFTIAGHLIAAGARVGITGRNQFLKRHPSKLGRACETHIQGSIHGGLGNQAV